MKSLLLLAALAFSSGAGAYTVKPGAKAFCPPGPLSLPYDVAATAFQPELIVNPANPRQLLFTMFVAYKSCNVKAKRFEQVLINPMSDSFYGTFPFSRSVDADFPGQFSDPIQLDLADYSLSELQDMLISLFSTHGYRDTDEYVRTLDRAALYRRLNFAIDSEYAAGYVENTIVTASAGTMVIDLDKVNRNRGNRIRVLLNTKIPFYLDFQVQDGRLVSYDVSAK